MAKSFNITPTLKKNTKVEPILAEKTTFKKTLKNVDAIKEKVEKIHTKDTPETVKSRVEVEVPQKVTKPKPVAKKVTSKQSLKKPASTVITENSKRMTVVMPKETHRLLKIKAINTETTLNELIVDLIEKNLGIR
jgi:hypothetical protein